MFLRRTGRRINHKENQASEHQADPEQNEHKGMARHEIKNPGDKPNGKDYRNKTTANLKGLLRLFLDEYEEKSSFDAPENATEDAIRRKGMILFMGQAFCLNIGMFWENRGLF